MNTTESTPCPLVLSEEHSSETVSYAKYRKHTHLGVGLIPFSTFNPFPAPLLDQRKTERRPLHPPFP